jgi:uncharacterized protein
VIAIDTNLLVYAHRAAVPEHQAARRALERAAGGDAGWGIAQPVLAEFWSVVTHPASAGGPSTPSQARAFLDALIRDGGAQVWLPSSGFGEQLLRAAVDRKVTGPRIFDLQIALVALGHGAHELWTHDREFLAPPGLRVVDPLRTTAR